MTRTWIGLVLLGGCTKDGGDTAITEDEAASFAVAVGPLLESRCLGCHQPIGDLPPSGALDLTDPLPAIIGVPSTQSVEMMLVEPGDSLYSYLWHKVNGSQSIAGGSGTSMPIGTVFTDEEIALVAAWIDAGANP